MDLKLRQFESNNQLFEIQTVWTPTGDSTQNGGMTALIYTTAQAQAQAKDKRQRSNESNIPKK